MKRALRLPRHFPIRPSGEVALRGIESLHLGAPAFVVRGGNEPVFRLEFLFRAGKLAEQQRHSATATAALMTEGTQGLTAHELAEAFEYYGATVRCYSTPDTLSLSVYGMTRFIQPVLHVVSEVLLAPAFYADELELYQRKKIQRYRLSLTQNEYIANRAFSEDMFGRDHAYGYSSTPDDISALTRESLIRHHALLTKECLSVFVAGNVDDALLQLTESIVRGLPHPGDKGNAESAMPEQIIGQRQIPGPQPHQTSVRIGKQIISRGHEDYPGLFLLNTILGGYHGSRLVRNLREAKGLTYNIQSNLENLLQAACFVVSTDANKEAHAAVLREIYREIRKLQTSVVEGPELEMVRNYINGNFLMQIDGPLNVVDTIKPLVLHALPLSYFEEFLAHIKGISAAQIRQLAQHYLDRDTMTEIVVG